VAGLRSQKEKYWYLELLPTSTKGAQRIWKKEKYLELVYLERDEVSSKEEQM